MSTKSTTERGNEFRDRVRDICIAAGYTPLTELKINGKNMDVCFEVPRMPHFAKVAIEAKFYEKNIGKRLVDEIIGSYKNAIERRVIDEVWVVVSSGFSADAQDTLSRNGGFFALSFTDLIKSMINFPRYVEFIKASIEQDGISEYYIDQKFEGSNDALLLLERWHAGNKLTPIAVLSTYGMGKSSLAKIFTLKLIENWKSDQLSRIPVLIKLGDLSAQQRIDGLLGSIFTNQITIHGYSFPLFQKLNSLGFLTIILDGLDEMRHAMTWNDFEYNFNQIRQIITPMTKCVLLGRPNTFQNEKEYKMVIEGKKYIGQVETRSANANEFTKYELEPFGESAIALFLERYIAYALRSIHKFNSIMIQSRVSEIEGLDLNHLFSRPIHAKMMAEIALDFDVPLKKFSRHELYDYFIESVLKRDYERHRGTGITPEARRHFLRELAWKSWFSDKENFRASQVEFEFYSEFVEERDPDGVLRELLSGSIIETKLGDVFYFGHRSFQEFLVAERFLLNARESVEQLKRHHITPEMEDFISENNDISKLKSTFVYICENATFSINILTALKKVHFRLLRTQAIDIESPENRWLWIFSTWRKIEIENPKNINDYDKFIYSLSQIRGFGNSIMDIVFVHQLYAMLSAHSKDENERPELVVASFLKICLSRLPFNRFFANYGENFFVDESDGYLANFVARTVVLRRSQEDDIEIKFDIGNFVHSMMSATQHDIWALYVAQKEELSFSLDTLGAQRDPTLTAVRKAFALSKGRLRFVQRAATGKRRADNKI